jgi:hypothetical protein
MKNTEKPMKIIFQKNLKQKTEEQKEKKESKRKRLL